MIRYIERMMAKRAREAVMTREAVRATLKKKQRYLNREAPKGRDTMARSTKSKES